MFEAVGEVWLGIPRCSLRRDLHSHEESQDVWLSVGVCTSADAHRCPRHPVQLPIELELHAAVSYPAWALVAELRSFPSHLTSPLTTYF